MLVILIIVILCCLKHIQSTKVWEFFLGYLRILSPKVYEFCHISFREKFHNFRSLSFRSLYFQEFVSSGVCLSGICLSGVCLSGVCLSGVCLSGVCPGTLVINVCDVLFINFCLLLYVNCVMWSPPSLGPFYWKIIFISSCTKIVLKIFKICDEVRTFVL